MKLCAHCRVTEISNVAKYCAPCRPIVRKEWKQKQKDLWRLKAGEATLSHADCENSYFAMTFEEIAEKEGVSRQYVHQIYRTAIVKIRAALEPYRNSL